MGGLKIPFAIAAAVHLGLAVGGHRHPKPAVTTPVAEIVLAPPMTEPERPAPESAAPPTAETVRPPPPVARAAALLTRRDNAPSRSPSDTEPADFVTDPNGTSFGSAVVARGGTAEVGSANDVPRAASSSSAITAPMDTIARASDLSRAARLTARDPCRGRYPRAARDDVADVSLTLVVGSSGEVRRATILGEQPAGQGFGEAARSCLLALRLEPALSRVGTSVTSVTTLVVHFSR